MKILQRKKLQFHYFNLVCRTESLRIKHRLEYFKDSTLDGIPYKELYVEALANEESTKDTIIRILGEQYFCSFFYNKSIDVRKKAYQSMVKTYKELQY